MALTRHIVYRDTDGEIIQSYMGDDASPPTAGAGETYLNAGPGLPPDPATNKIVADTITPKDQAQQDAERDAKRKAELERAIGVCDATRDAMQLRGYPVAEIDAEIATMVIERDALP